MWSWFKKWFTTEHRSVITVPRMYQWIHAPYHPDLMLVTLSTPYKTCIEYTAGLQRIIKTIKEGGEIINYMVYRDVETVSLRDWLLDENGYYCNDVSVNVEEWRETCNEFMVAYQSLRDHIDYKKQCESKLLVHLVNNITTLEKSFMDITVE